MSESTVTFRHEYSESFKLKGVKHLIKQNIIDGSKGLSFMFLKKVGDNDFYKVYAMEHDGKYKVEETKGEKKTESELSEADVKKMLKSNKDFDFVLNYMDNDRGKYKGKVMRGGALPDQETMMMPMEQDGGAKKRRSRKTSKKTSKRKVMKGGALPDQENPMMPMEQDGGAKKRSSKKTSRKASRKASKKGSKKMTGGGKKRSKKASKKASKKRSKKSSKKMTGGGKKRSKKASKKVSKKASRKSRK